MEDRCLHSWQAFKQQVMIRLGGGGEEHCVELEGGREAEGTVCAGKWGQCLVVEESERPFKRKERTNVVNGEGDIRAAIAAQKN